MAVCVRLPRLHPAFCSWIGSQVYRLSMGIRECCEDGEWLPDNYPFAPREAAQLLAELRQMDLNSLEALRLSMGRSAVGEQLREQNEMADLAKFAGEESIEDDWVLLRRHAHKVLLWLYLLEEQQAELVQLEKACTVAEANLAHNFSELNYAAIGHISAESRLPRDALWRISAAQACVFIPLHMPIWVEGDMAQDLREQLDFAAVTFATGQALGAMAPLWQVLGMSRPMQADGMANLVNLYNGKRQWLMLL